MNANVNARTDKLTRNFWWIMHFFVHKHYVLDKNLRLIGEVRKSQSSMNENKNQFLTDRCY